MVQTGPTLTAAVLLLASLGGCVAPAHLPPEDRRAREAPAPQLLPLAQLTGPAALPETAADPAPALGARAAALDARAARLRAQGLTPAERQALGDMRARHR